MGDGGEFAGTICSICYEPLKPITEDLQSISICGHVFHELCLQQWFEYCSSKKHTCPICKQGCKANDACRLYFQSVGDGTDPVVTQKRVDLEEDAGVLRHEVKRLESKVSGINSVLERQTKELEELKEELCTCKKQTKIEKTLKNEALNQKTSMQFQLTKKTEELEKSSLECFRLKDTNMALAKELAALKLVSDVNLDEEEILKLATLGNGVNSNETVDTLKRSLVLRNRSYKELMAKCNLLGSCETRYSKKLEKAKEKISKLKVRVVELEKAAEVKEKAYLKSLKESKNLESRIKPNSDVLTPKSGTVPNANDNNNSLKSSKTENSKATKNKDVDIGYGSKTAFSLDEESDCIIIDDDASEFTKDLPGQPKHDYKHQVRDDLAKPEEAHCTKTETPLLGKCNLAVSSRVDIDPEMVDISADTMDEDVTLQANVEQFKPMINIRKESPFTASNSVDICFSGGLLGPDGSNRFLGKWCKRGQNGESASTKGSSNGNLIAVGADGRGGKVKVLRSPSQGFSDKENSVSSKKMKLGSKTSSLQPRGSLQIEHFFGRVSQ